MAKRAAHKRSTYFDAYETLSKVKTLNFEPTKTRHYVRDENGKRRAMYEYDFTPQQKATLSRLAFEKKETERGIVHQRSHLYVLAKMVENGDAELVKPKGRKAEKKKQLAFFKQRGFKTTDKGFFNTRENAKKSKVVKFDERIEVDGEVKKVPAYRLEYINDSGKSPPGVGGQVDARVMRREQFVPFPRSIIGNPDAIIKFAKNLIKAHKPNEMRVAVNGHQGLTAYDPKEFTKYIKELEDDYGESVLDSANPFINGFYVIYKARVIEYAKPIKWGDPRADKQSKKRIRKTGRR